jgi:hypothetical protein
VEVIAHLIAPTAPLPTTDIAVANISLEAIQALTGRVDATTLVTSGYLASEQPDLPGFQHHERRTLQGWASDVYTRA